MRARLGSFLLTPAGGGLILVLAAAVVVLLVGPRHDQTPAFVVIAVVLALALVRGVTGRGVGPGA